MASASTSPLLKEKDDKYDLLRGVIYSIQARMDPSVIVK